MCLANENSNSPLLPPHAPYIVPLYLTPSRWLKAEVPLSESWIKAAKELYQKPEDYSAGAAASTIVKFLSSTAIGVTLCLLSGLTLTATVMALIVVTPAAVLFSPVLVPAGIFVFLVGVGFVLAMVGAIWGLSLLFKYVSKKKNWTEFLFDLGRSLLRKYLKMRFGWIGWLWSLWEWIK